MMAAAATEVAPVVHWLVECLFYSKPRGGASTNEFNTFFTGYLFSLNTRVWAPHLKHVPYTADEVRRRIAGVDAQYLRKLLMQQSHAQEEEESTPFVERRMDASRLLRAAPAAQTAFYLREYFKRPRGTMPAPPCYASRVRRTAALLRGAADRTQADRLGLCLAVVNSATLFDRDRLRTEAQRAVVAQVRESFIDADDIGLSMHSKLSVATHVGMNFREQLATRADCGWLFAFFKAQRRPLLAHFASRGGSADITLDLVAEIVTCYHYAGRCPGAYEQFVIGEVARKYAASHPSQYTYRYFAHVDYPSDHEAISLYHMSLAQAHSSHSRLPAL